MVDVKAGQEPDGSGILKVHHADHTLFHFLVSRVGAEVEDSSGQVVDEADALGDADLLLLGQLAGQATLTRGGMVHGLFLVGRRRLSGQAAPLRLVQQRQVIRALGKQTVPH